VPTPKSSAVKDLILNRPLRSRRKERKGFYLFENKNSGETKTRTGFTGQADSSQNHHVLTGDLFTLTTNLFKY
jgi:hypothetical protein